MIPALGVRRLSDPPEGSCPLIYPTGKASQVGLPFFLVLYDDGSKQEKQRPKWAKLGDKLCVVATLHLATGNLF